MTGPIADTPQWVTLTLPTAGADPRSTVRFPLPRVGYQSDFVIKIEGQTCSPTKQYIPSDYVGMCGTFHPTMFRVYVTHKYVYGIYDIHCT